MAHDYGQLEQKAIYRWNAAHQTDKTQGQVFVPKRIVVFRDGVSEGEYERIAKEELTIMHSTSPFLRAWRL